MVDMNKWQELKETIEELSTNDGNCNQKELCHFLLNLMQELDRQEVENGDNI